MVTSPECSAGASGTVYRALLCVADGMGGLEAGEIASGAALAVVLAGAAPFAAASVQTSDLSTHQAVPESAPAVPDPVVLVRRAATAVHAASDGRQMGTTVTCVVVDGGTLTLAHVGDTRAYLLRGTTLTQLTADHSLVAAMVASGVLTKEQARGHPDSNKVLRSLGSQRELPDGYVGTLADVYGEPTLVLQPDDWLVLCTDGVWGQVSDEEISATVSAAVTPTAAASTLLASAIAAGAPDNAAAIVARCVRVPGP